MEPTYRNILDSNKIKNYGNTFTLVSIPERLPARLNAEQVAKVLNFSARDIPVLCQHGLLKPLAKPSPNSTKYFSSFVIEKLGADEEWLNDATQVIYDYWKGKNERKTSKLLLSPKRTLQSAIAA